MRVKTITVDKASVTVRSRFRGSAILDAKYRSAIRAVYPEIGPVQIGVLSSAAPTITDSAMITPTEQIALDRHNQKMAALAAENELGMTLYNNMTHFLWRARRILSAQNAPFEVVGGELVDAAAAFTSFLAEDEDEESEPGLWTAIGRAVLELDAPTTPDFQQPLTTEEVKALDPLAVAPVGTGNSPSQTGH